MDPEAQAYVEAVIALYRRLPDTATPPRCADRHLAAHWHRRGVRLELLDAALRLASARRLARDPEAPPLPPVRSLHYYRPVVDELLALPDPDRYAAYLRHRLAMSGSPLIPDPGAPSKNDVSR